MNTAFGHIIEGMGISKQLEITKSSDQENRDEQINKSGNEELLAFLKTITKSGDSKETKDNSVKKETQGNVVRKNLANVEVLKGMLDPNLRKGA